MWLGSWAIIQIQGAAEEGRRGTPTTSASCPSRPRWTASSARIAPDYNQAVNIHSKHKAAARAWIDWFTDKSGYAEDNLAISPLKDAPLPDDAEAVRGGGREVHRAGRQRQGAEVKDIDNQSEVGIYAPDYRQNLVDLARGAREGDLDDFFADLSKRWTDAREPGVLMADTTREGGRRAATRRSPAAPRPGTGPAPASALLARRRPPGCSCSPRSPC